MFINLSVITFDCRTSSDGFIITKGSQIRFLNLKSSYFHYPLNNNCPPQSRYPVDVFTNNIFLCNPEQKTHPPPSRRNIKSKKSNVLYIFALCILYAVAT